jgi:hypothetical protein
MIVDYITHIGPRAEEIRYDSMISVIEGVSEFVQPYCWVFIRRDTTSYKRFEALVRYFLLLKGSTNALKDNTEEFSTHFPGAFRAIAAAKGVEEERPGVEES